MNYEELLRNHHHSLYMHQEHGGNWKVIKTPENGGFTKCVNFGIRYLWKRSPQYKYMLLLNNDAILNPGWLEKMVAAFDDPLPVGIVADASAVWCPDSIYPSPLGWTEPYTHEKGENPIEVRTRMIQTLQCKSYYEEHIGFWGCLLRFDLFEKFGLFDEEFKVICQDLDFCWRIGARGWKIKVINDGTNLIYHRGKTHCDLKPKSEIDPLVEADQRRIRELWPQHWC